MTPPFPDFALADLIDIYDQHATTPKHFFHAWRKAVRLAGPQYFGANDPTQFDNAPSKWELCPDVLLIESAIGVTSHSEQVFLAALVSVYNDETGGTPFVL
ncbi:hypothetical protein J1G36_11710 [Pseudomonas carnis]|uniref:hypothetical protein n=1 Tax=Pseudomonas TaxID=286 RepID=UPI000F56BE72|nr:MULTISPECIES: hypothetical protein [Pseudomonas]AZC90174.1 hypothetical protein C4K29_3875 [Pseudomonas chlororaphis subsp. piscium]MBY8952561.1 hypothetical protein [Pseudomonas carnis]